MTEHRSLSKAIDGIEGTVDHVFTNRLESVLKALATNTRFLRFMTEFFVTFKISY